MKHEIVLAAANLLSIVGADQKKTVALLLGISEEVFQLESFQNYFQEMKGGNTFIK